jgi:L-threonylcarbamoyladenylate synthase
MTVTRYIKVDATHPQTDIISLGSELIKAGELVAFPTETVYGLGADAFQPGAVAKIFKAKGRPPENALLVHVSNMDQVERLVAEIPAIARKLMDRFWPGPLSIILPAKSSVPDIVRGGSIGIGLRMPSHPVALALIDAAGPIAAPSANLYGRPSPTNAHHVQQDLDGKIAAVLDAGETGAGLESTLLDLSTGSYSILRRGGVSEELIEEFLGFKIPVAVAKELPHYTTKVKIILSENHSDFEVKLDYFSSQGLKLGLVHINEASLHRIVNVSCIYNLSLSGHGENLYSIVRDAEEKGVEILLFAPVDPDQAKSAPAIMDRILRAASLK